MNGGETIADSFRRFGKGKREIWLQATYNPVYNANGEIYRVVKFATDVTKRMASVGVLGDAIRELAAGNLTAQVSAPIDPSMETTTA